MAVMHRRVRPPGGFELWWWYFMRLSGLLLVFLAVGHLLIMHVAHNVEQVSYAFVVSRWTNPRFGVFWRLWDLTLINLAVLHAFNGVRQVFYEYIHRPFQRVVAATLLWSGTIVLILVGTYAILRFEPDKSYLDRFYSTNPNLRPVSATTHRDELPASSAKPSQRSS